MQKPHEALQESPFNKGAVHEVDWGFLKGEKQIMQNQFSRTELLIGKEGIEKLQNAKVAIFRDRRSGLLCRRSISKSRNWTFYFSRP